MKNLNIADVLERCILFMGDPDNEAQNFDQLLQSLVVKSYMPIEQKELILAKVFKDIKMLDREVFTFTSQVEVSLTFDALLAYANIDSDMIDALKITDYADVLWASGFCDQILKFCEKDYNRLSGMVYHMLSYENLFALMDQMKDFDSESIEELTKEFKRFRLETKPESLIALGNIAAHNDPVLYGIKDAAEGMAYEQAMKKEGIQEDIEDKTR